MRHVSFMVSKYMVVPARPGSNESSHKAKTTLEKPCPLPCFDRLEGWQYCCDCLAKITKAIEILKATSDTYSVCIVTTECNTLHETIIFLIHFFHMACYSAVSILIVTMNFMKTYQNME